jgi:hypothetical protein
VIKVHAAGHEMFGHLLGLFAEAGYSVRDFAGGNEFYVPDDLVIEDPELHAEIVKAARPGSALPPLAPRPPGGGDSPAPSVPTPQAASPGTSASGVPAGQADLPALPPKAGPGSSRAEWVKAAGLRGKTVTDSMSRDDIIQLLEADDDGR